MHPTQEFAVPASVYSKSPTRTRVLGVSFLSLIASPACDCVTVRVFWRLDVASGIAGGFQRASARHIAGSRTLVKPMGAIQRVFDSLAFGPVLSFICAVLALLATCLLWLPWLSWLSWLSVGKKREMEA